MATEWKTPMAWDNAGTAPSDNLKEVGFKAGDKPPASVFNYFLNTTAECIEQIQGAVDEKAEAEHTHTLDDVSETTDKKIMTAAERTKLAGLSTVATSGSYNDLSDTPTIPSSLPANGGNADTVDNLHASDFAKAEHTHTLDDVSETTDKKIMTAAERTKLSGIASGANAYTHPSYTARTGVPTANQTPAFGGTFSVSQPVSDASGHVTEVNSRTITIPNTAASTSAAGLMSSADKSKLDGIASGANKTTVDSALSSSSTNPVQNKVINTALANKADTGHTHTLDDVSETTGKRALHIVSASSSDGVAYTGTASGVTSLFAGLTVIFVPSMTSESTAPTFNLNGLGAKTIKRRLSNISSVTQAGYANNWLYTGKPFQLIYDGSVWIVDGATKPAVADMYGTVPVDKGGTGATDAATARTNLGLSTENWTFTLEDGTTVTKAVYVG